MKRVASSAMRPADLHPNDNPVPGQAQLQTRCRCRTKRSSHISGYLSNSRWVLLSTISACPLTGIASTQQRQPVRQIRFLREAGFPTNGRSLRLTLPSLHAPLRPSRQEVAFVPSGSRAASSARTARRSASRSSDSPDANCSDAHLAIIAMMSTTVLRPSRFGARNTTTETIMATAAPVARDAVLIGNEHQCSQGVRAPVGTRWGQGVDRLALRAEIRADHAQAFGPNGERRRAVDAPTHST
jgi:hypothetical protein